MSEKTDPTRLYSDREVRLILKSAVELQHRLDSTRESRHGMSLAELEQVAAEVGLDPGLVRRAAAQLTAVRRPTDRNPFLGSPTQVIIERTLDVELDASQFDQLLDITRSVTAEVGEVSTVGRQFGWKGRMDGAKTEVSVSAAERSTTIRVKIDLDEHATGHFMLKGMLGGVGGGFAVSAATVTLFGPVGFVAAAATLASGYYFARRGLRGEEQRFRHLGSELVERLAERINRIARNP